jgi:hypothetical protein
MTYLLDGDLNVKYASESVAEKFNCKTCDIVGKSIYDLIGRMHSRNGKGNLMKAFTTGVPLQSTTEVIFPTGPRMLSTVLFPIKDADGKVIEVLGVSYDITGHHDREQMVRNKMEIILGYAEVLGNMIDDEEARKMIAKIKDASTHLQQNLNRGNHPFSNAPPKQP